MRSDAEPLRRNVTLSHVRGEARQAFPPVKTLVVELLSTSWEDIRVFAKLAKTAEAFLLKGVDDL